MFAVKVIHFVLNMMLKAYVFTTDIENIIIQMFQAYLPILQGGIKNVFENFIKKFEKLSNDNKKIVIIKTFKVLNLEKTQIALTKDEIDYFKLLLVKALM